MEPIEWVVAALVFVAAKLKDLQSSFELIQGRCDRLIRWQQLEELGQIHIIVEED